MGQEYVSLCEDTEQPTLRARFYLTRVRLLEGQLLPEDARPVIEQFVATQMDPLQPIGGLLGSPVLAGYVAVLMAAFHVRVVVAEEPWLERQFGDAWSAYAAQVPRWIGVGRRRAG